MLASCSATSIGSTQYFLVWKINDAALLPLFGSKLACEMLLRHFPCTAEAVLANVSSELLSFIGSNPERAPGNPPATRHMDNYINVLRYDALHNHSHPRSVPASKPLFASTSTSTCTVTRPRAVNTRAPVGCRTCNENAAFRSLYGSGDGRRETTACVHQAARLAKHGMTAKLARGFIC
jgi:hypothetical protein